MMPFTRDQFFDVFAAYNAAIWPLQVLAYALGAVVIAALWLPPRAGRLVAFGVLALFWIWTGVGYHVFFFAPVNPIAIVFGALFVAQAVLFHYFALRSTFEFSRDARGRVLGWSLLALSMVIYPLVGMLNGDVYPWAPMFGVTPCPLVIFTLGLLLFGRQKTPLVLLVIPALWALIGGAAAVLLGVIQDVALPLSALVAILANAVLWRRNSSLIADAALARPHRRATSSAPQR